MTWEWVVLILGGGVLLVVCIFIENLKQKWNNQLTASTLGNPLFNWEMLQNFQEFMQEREED